MAKRTRKTSFFVDKKLKENADMQSFLKELKQKIRYTRYVMSILNKLALSDSILIFLIVVSSITVR